MSAAVHGGAPAGWLELSANLDPHGTPEAVRRAIAARTYGAYADLDPRGAERELARGAGVDPSWVMLTSGATEALRLVMTALVDPGDTVVVAGPTYAEYARLARSRGARVEEVRAAPPRFSPRPAALARHAAETGAKLAIACEPNNPTGRAAGRAALVSLARALPRESYLVVDESFLPFAEARPRGVAGLARAIAVRSLTKVLATPGIRAGYVVAAPSVLARLRDVRDPWAVGAHACAAASVASWALSPSAMRDLVRWRASTMALLRRSGMTPLPSRACFVLAHVGPDAHRIVAALARHRVAVRWCDSFGLPHHIRVAVRPPEEQRLLAAALRAVRS